MLKFPIGCAEQMPAHISMTTATAARMAVILSAAKDPRISTQRAYHPGRPNETSPVTVHAVCVFNCDQPSSLCPTANIT